MNEAYQVQKGQTGNKTTQTEMESIKINKICELAELAGNRN